MSRVNERMKEWTNEWKWMNERRKEWMKVNEWRSEVSICRVYLWSEVWKEVEPLLLLFCSLASSPPLLSFFLSFFSASPVAPSPPFSHSFFFPVLTRSGQACLHPHSLSFSLSLSLSLSCGLHQIWVSLSPHSTTPLAFRVSGLGLEFRVRICMFGSV